MKSETMKVAVVILGLVAILGATFAVSAFRGSQRPGELAFDLENVDAGTVPLGQAVIQRFPMRNVGEKPVTITKKVAAMLEGC